MVSLEEIAEEVALTVPRARRAASSSASGMVVVRLLRQRNSMKALGLGFGICGEMWRGGPKRKGGRGDWRQP